uniref:Retrotransposable element Tf2 n=1 Tax=Cajanus cajan TaxID=3821 RepID=A0A151RUK2_CAJCA|nr:Retrotransposable element Tf2 [Cajanus cajan]
MAFQGVQIQLSTSYHPQTDGQSEVVNRCLETYLRCMCADSPQNWSKWLPMAEWWYNTTYHIAIKATPYEIMYGQPPPIYLPYLPGESKVELVDRSLRKREEMLKLIKFHLRRA